MIDETKNPDIDLDEDLFDFGDSSLSDVFDGEDDADLDEIFAAFQEAQLNEPRAEDEGELDPEVDEDDGLEDFFEPEQPVRKPERLEQPRAEKVWTPETALASESNGAPRRPRAPQAAQESSTVVVKSSLSRSALWALVAVTSVNALVALVTLSSMSTMRSSVVEVGQHVTATADEIRSGAYEQARVLNDLQTPVVPLDAEEHPTFDRARAEISKGQYGEARRRLYALLSIIDRLDPDQRAKVEARAQYLLAEALHLEALERLEVER